MEHAYAAIYEELSIDDLLKEIDREAQRRLGMSGEEFAEKYHRGELPDTLVTTELAILQRCVDRAPVPA